MVILEFWGCFEMISSAAGKSPFLSRLYDDASQTARIAFADMDQTALASNIEAGPFRAAQIAAIYGTMPLFVLAHIIVASAVAHIADARLNMPLASWWFLLALLPVIMVAWLWIRHNRQHSATAPHVEIRIIEFMAILFGSVWAICPVMFFPPDDANLRTLIAGTTIAAAAVGTFALSRVASAAILYCFITTMSLAMSAVWLGDVIGLAFMFMTMALGMALAGIVLKNHRDQVRRAIDAQMIANDKDIISLLLNDFEHGTSDWLWECDAGGMMTHVSPRLAEAVGKAPSELMSLTLREGAGADVTDNGWAELERTMDECRIVAAQNLEVRLVDRTLHWQISARPLLEADGAFAGYRGVGRDVTAEWETDNRLFEAKVAAETASAAKSQFLAVMSHELRTPLNSIVGFSEILSRRSDDVLDIDTRLDYARTILESSRHLQTLIDDILDATRIEKGSISLVDQDLDPAELVEIVVKMCRDQAENADVTLVARLADGVELKADITRIKQVILNLLTNAIKFSPPGGIVNVEILRSPQDKLVLVVRDAGIGIRDEDLSRIFEPFVQAEDGMARRFAGIGLGLSIARKIARLHGGDITLESEYGAGTTARFEMPASRVTWPKARARSSGHIAA